jgi:glycosyltransferase involved in cell wall biosynthesis
MTKRFKTFATMNGVEGSAGTPGVSGGDVRLMRVLKLLSDRVDFTLSTTPMGKELCTLNGVVAEYKIMRTSDRPGILGNLERVIASCGNIPREHIDVAYSGGEHLYDVLPAAILRIFRRVPWIALVHWVEELPWRDKRGGTPALHRYLYWLNRVAAMFFIKAFASRVLAVSESTRQKLIATRGFEPQRVSTVYCGLDLAAANCVRTANEPKAYDAVFMKRLNFGKGVRDLIEIWEKVVRVKSGARLQVIGSGPPAVVAEIERLISAKNLERNIDLVGVVHDAGEKIRRLAQSSIFVLPSHEENWAIVIGEALAAGLPVVAYDLKEIRPLWGERVHWIALGDTSAFAQKILQLDSQPSTVPLDDFLRDLDWPKIADNEYAEMSRLVPA